MYAWKASYLVGLPQIDIQHQQLFALVNELHNAMKAGKSREVLGAVLDELVSYTVKHFAAEEAFLNAHKYPEASQHRAIHEQFTATIRKFQRDYESGAQMVTLELMDVLGKWLVDHIQGTDMKYALQLGARN